MAVFFFQQRTVKRLDRLQSGLLGHPSIGVISDDLTGSVEVRSDVGEYPVVVTILRHVVHIGEYLPAIGNGVPKQFEDASWHFGVPYDRMWFPHHLGFGIAADRQKHIVDVGQPSFGIGLADDQFVMSKSSLVT